MSERDIRIERTTVLRDNNSNLVFKEVSSYYSIYVGDDPIYNINMDELKRLNDCIGRIVQHEEEYKAIEDKIKKGGKS